MSVAKSLASSIARSVAQLVALADGGTSYRAETTAYQARVASGGGSMTAAGLSFVDAIFANAETQSITLQRGHLFGTAVNLPASELEVLEMTGDGEPFTLESTGTRYDGLGSLCLSSEVANQGRGYLATESWVTQTDATYFIYGYRPLNNSIGATAVASGTFIGQYPSGSPAGALLWQQGGTSAFTCQGVGNTTISPNATSGTYPWGTAAISGPVCLFITYTAASKTLASYNPITGVTASVVCTNHPHQSKTFIGGTEFTTLNYRPGPSMAYAALLKYNSVLTQTQMNSVWRDAVGPNKLVDVAMVYGTSVTSGSDSSEGTSEGANSWFHKTGITAARNNTWLQMPQNMGGKNLTFYVPSDWVKHVSSTMSPNIRDAYQTIDIWKYVYPTILCIDDQQNFAAKSLVDYTIDFKFTIDAIYQDCVELMPSCKLVVGTQLALQAFTVPGGVAQTYAEVAADSFKVKLRDWSITTRTDTDFDAYFEIYGPFNTGYDTADDGDTFTPLTDLPNGDASLYYDDAQHPNAAGHAIFAGVIWTAIDSVRLY